MIVREHINEVFTQDSDPIKDMGIGINFKPGAIVEVKKMFCTKTVDKINPWGSYIILGGNRITSSLPIGIKGIIFKSRMYQNNNLKMSIAFFGVDEGIHKVLSEFKQGHIKRLMGIYSVGFGKAPLSTWIEYLNFNVKL